MGQGISGSINRLIDRAQGNFELVNELRRLEKLSVWALTLAVEHRTGGASRLSDVLRYVTEEFACFDVDDTSGGR
jgi:hypothetical protein